MKISNNLVITPHKRVFIIVKKNFFFYYILGKILEFSVMSGMKNGKNRSLDKKKKRFIMLLDNDKSELKIKCMILNIHIYTACE